MGSACTSGSNNLQLLYHYWTENRLRKIRWRQILPDVGITRNNNRITIKVPHFRSDYYFWQLPTSQVSFFIRTIPTTLIVWERVQSGFSKESKTTYPTYRYKPLIVNPEPNSVNAIQIVYLYAEAQFLILLHNIPKLIRCYRSCYCYSQKSWDWFDRCNIYCNKIMTKNHWNLEKKLTLMLFLTGKFFTFFIIHIYF